MIGDFSPEDKTYPQKTVAEMWVKQLQVLLDRKAPEDVARARLKHNNLHTRCGNYPQHPNQAQLLTIQNVDAGAALRLFLFMNFLQIICLYYKAGI